MDNQRKAWSENIVEIGTYNLQTQELTYSTKFEKQKYVSFGIGEMRQGAIISPGYLYLDNTDKFTRYFVGEKMTIGAHIFNPSYYNF